MGVHPYTMQHLHLWILLLAASNIMVSGDSILDCCKEKTVGGVDYLLVGLSDSDTKRLGCKSDCMFERKDSPGSRFCFATGDLEVTCEDDEGTMIDLKTIRLPKEYKEKLFKQLTIIENCFENKAVDGKIAVSDVLEVTNAANIKLKDAGLAPKNTSKDFQDDLQGVVDNYEGEDQVDWKQFGSLLMQARTFYYQSLLKSLLEKLQLGDTDKITRADLEKMEMMVKEEGNEELAKLWGYLNYILLSNFDGDNDETIQIADFLSALNNMHI